MGPRLQARVPAAGRAARPLPLTPRIALTATADAVTRREIHDRLGLESAVEFVSSVDRPNIRYPGEIKDDPKKQLLAFLRGGEGSATGTRRSDPMTKSMPRQAIPIVF